MTMRPNFIRFLTTVLTFALVAQIAFAQEPADEKRQKLRDKGEVPKEILMLRKKLVLDMENIELHRAYHRAMRKHDLLKQLQKECTDFYNAAPEKSLAVYIYSRIQEDIGKRKVLLNKYITLEPKKPWAYVDLGEIAIGNKNLDEAAKHFAKAEQLADKKIGVFCEIAGEYQRGNFSEKAIEFYEKAIALDASHRESLERLASVCIKAGQNEKTVKYGDMLIRLEAKNGWYWNMYGIGLMNTGKKDQARTAFLKALELKPKYGPAAYNLGLTYFNEGDFKTAMDWFKKSTEWDPHYYNGWTKVGHILYKRLEDWKGAVEHCVAALKYFPTDRWFYNVTSASLLNLKREAEANVYQVLGGIVQSSAMQGIQDGLAGLFDEGPPASDLEQKTFEGVKLLPTEHLKILVQVMPAIMKHVEHKEKMHARARSLKEAIDKAYEKRPKAPDKSSR
jgi:tetratricopeptide (TPR) repeat protein